MKMNFSAPLPTAPSTTANEANAHPLNDVLDAVLHQVTKGKGSRHGGDSIPFWNQSWHRIALDHGVGFLTGQAQKKLVEAQMKEDFAAFEREMLGAMAYLGMALLYAKRYDTWPGK